MHGVVSLAAASRPHDVEAKLLDFAVGKTVGIAGFGHLLVCGLVGGGFGAAQVVFGGQIQGIEGSAHQCRDQ